MADDAVRMAAEIERLRAEITRQRRIVHDLASRRLEKANEARALREVIRDLEWRHRGRACVPPGWIREAWLARRGLDSDVDVVRRESSHGYHCLCSDRARARSAEAMRRHLREHERGGDRVPARLYEVLPPWPQYRCGHCLDRGRVPDDVDIAGRDCPRCGGSTAEDRRVLEDQWVRYGALHGHGALEDDPTWTMVGDDAPSTRAESDDG